MFAQHLGEDGWFAHHPNFTPLMFAHLMGGYKRLRLNQDREFHLGRGSGQSKSSTSFDMISIYIITRGILWI